jgi:sugar lactone lactonase YvrE
MLRYFAVKKRQPECKRLRAATLFSSLLLILLLSSLVAYAAVPAVVGTVKTNLGNDWGNASNLALDSAGNLYVLDTQNMQIFQMLANGSTKTAIATGLPDHPKGLTVDSTGSVWFTDQWSDGVWKIAKNAGSYAAPAKIFGNIPNINVWWFNGADIKYINSEVIGTDTFDNFFFATWDQNVYKVQVNRSNNSVTGTAVGSTGNNGGAMFAVDANGNGYYVDGKSLFQIPAGTTSFNKIAADAFTKAVGVSVDGAGNVYVSDSPNSDGTGSSITVLPNENGTINVADKFKIFSGVLIANALPSPSGAIYLPSWGAINTLAFSATTADTALHTPSAAVTVNYVFNADVTPTISYVSMGAATGEFGSAGDTTTCSSKAYAAGDACNIDVALTAAKPGQRRGAIIMSDSTGAPLSIFDVSGVGLGSGLVINPGTQNDFGSGFTTPHSVAVDGAGNVYVADSGLTALLKFPAGGGDPVNVGSGLSNPSGVAIAGNGDVYIADTGNSRVVVVPNESGTLNNANQAVIASGLNVPTGIALDGLGNVYVAESTDVRRLTKTPVGTYTSTTVGSGFTTPTAVAVDPAGNVYVADSGANKVFKVPAAGGSSLTVATAASPSGVTVDAAGSVYIADTGNLRVVRIPFANGAFDPNGAVVLGSGLTTPTGIALDTAGNLYIADLGSAPATSPKVFLLARTQGSLNFGKSLVNTPTDPLAASLYNIGNQPLTLTSPLPALGGANPEDFAVTDGCTAASPLAMGAVCSVSAIFTPGGGGSRSATLSVPSDAANAAAISINMVGTGTVPVGATVTTLVMTSPASGNPVFGQTPTFTVTVAAASGIGTPSGTVFLTLDGVAMDPLALTDGSVTVPLAGLAGGTHTIKANYSGSDDFDPSKSDLLTITVDQAVSSLALTANLTTAHVTEDVVFTAVVSSAVTGVPTGTVSFYKGTDTTPFGQGILNGGAATYTAAAGSLAPGSTYQITAKYSGDQNFASATASAVSLTVIPAPTFDFASNVSNASVTPGLSPLRLTTILDSWIQMAKPQRFNTLAPES